MNSTYKNPVIAGLNVRSVLIDVFKETQHAGETPPGYNPALATKQPRRKVTRQLLSYVLTFDSYRKIPVNRRYRYNIGWCRYSYTG